MQQSLLSLLTHSCIFCSLSFLLLACTNGSHNDGQFKEWSTAQINPKTAVDDAYKQLDAETEVFSFSEKEDNLMKRTSGVAYTTTKNLNFSSIESARLNNCRAYFYRSDTLSINVGIGSGFGGWGFIILYKNKKFYTEPYFATDLIIEGAPEPIYQLVYQKLTLDKSSYKLGDSLYGYIDFKSIEIDEDKKKIEHKGKGYFRTKIRELGSM